MRAWLPGSPQLAPACGATTVWVGPATHCYVQRRDQHRFDGGKASRCARHISGLIVRSSHSRYRPVHLLRSHERLSVWEKPTKTGLTSWFLSSPGRECEEAYPRTKRTKLQEIRPPQKNNVTPFTAWAFYKWCTVVYKTQTCVLPSCNVLLSALYWCLLWGVSTAHSNDPRRVQADRW